MWGRVGKNPYLVSIVSLRNFVGVRASDRELVINTMSIHLLESFALVGALIAAVAVAVVGGLGFVVWLAGGRRTRD
jgi:hypothetical protein